MTFKTNNRIRKNKKVIYYKLKLEVMREYIKPKEKAYELYQKHVRYTPVEFEHEYTKKACFITIDQMIEQQKEQSEDMHWSCISYWEEVKYAIEKL